MSFCSSQQGRSPAASNYRYERSDTNSGGGCNLSGARNENDDNGDSSVGRSRGTDIGRENGDCGPDNGRGDGRDLSGDCSRSADNMRAGGCDLSSGHSRGLGIERGGGRASSGGRSRDTGNDHGGGRNLSGGLSRGLGIERGGGRDSSGGRSRGTGKGRGDGGRDLSGGRSRDTGDGRGGGRDTSGGRSRGIGNGRGGGRDSSGVRSRGTGNGRSGGRDSSGGRRRGTDNGHRRGGRDSSGDRSRRTGNGRGHTSGDGRNAAYDSTLYNFFDGSKYSESHGYGGETVTYKLSATDMRKVSKSIINLIGMMFDEEDMKNLFISLQLDTTLLKSDRFTKDLILKALSTLSSSAIYICDQINGTGSPNKKQSNPILNFLKMIPFINRPMIKTNKEIAFYTNGLNDIYLMMDACDIIKKYHRDPNFYYKYYKALKTKLRPLENDSDEYRKIVEYAKNSHGPTHKYDLKIDKIFKVSRRDEFTKYKKFKQTYGMEKLLWFGARATNYPSILLKGIRVAPHQSPSIGNKYGRGIYFTDCITKAANFCQANQNKPYGLLLLTEVALGNSLKFTKSENITALRNGKNSVKGLGKYIPDPNGHIVTHNKVQVPLGKMIQDSTVNTDLNYNEYVVYNPDQVLIQYLVKVKFNFN